ncbi:MAG: molybdopterin cofactor-binding domain-containing protein, partial [Anaerolineaceae bacterium]
MPIGNSNLRLDALAKAAGKSQYAGDFNFANQLYLKLLFTRYPHAVVRAVHTEKAEAVPGVVAVFTSKDVPVNEYGLGFKDQPVLCGPGSGKPFADRARFIGDQIAVVAAESEEIAAQAVRLIEVDYEPLPVVTDPHKALEQGAVLLHPERENNVIHSYRIRKGDVQKGFADADVIVESSYETPVQEHAFLQPEAGVAYLDEEDRVTVVAAGQWAHEEQEQIAHALGLPMPQVRVIQPAIGGAFGGREDISIQIVLALAAYRLAQRGIRRPVKLVWSREESMFGHGKRHPYFMHARWGAKRDGTLVAAEISLVADGGAYSYTSPKVLGNATLMCTGPYEIPHVHVDSCVVYTNNLPNGAFRGFGGPQGAYLA